MVLTRSKLETRPSVVDQLIAAGKAFYSRNWVLGNAGNFSAVICRDPLQWVITRNSAHKGNLTELDFVRMNDFGQSLDSGREPPPESPLHRAIILKPDVEAVLHTHSVWSNVLSELYAHAGGLTMEGFEMLKGLTSTGTHQHTEWVPILENLEDSATLSRRMTEMLSSNRGIHGILLRKCGCYTWGKTVNDAIRQVEILEVLFEVLGRHLHILTQLEINAQNGTRM